jgi:hypothetical protein
VKTMFFYSLGIFCVFPWNSVLNLNGYFEDAFQNKTISQAYTFWYFLFTLVAIYLSMVIDHKFKIYDSIRFMFIAILVSFNLLYFVCDLLEISNLKYFLFYSLIVSLSTCHFIFEVL